MSDADTHRSTPGHAYAVASRATSSKPAPDYFFITKGNTLDDALGEHFATHKEARARADELNERDVIKERRLSKKQEARARRLRDLDYGGWGDRHSWIRKVGRYAIGRYWDDGEAGWDTVSTLALLREELKDCRVERVVDLDTGDEVPYTRVVTVEIGRRQAE